jgi:hypothetical protein
MRNVYNDAIENIFEQYKESTNIKKIIEIFCDQLQEIESVVLENYSINDMDSATGKVLDRIGEIAGQQRNGFNDDTYRMIVKTRIAALYSGGNREDIINLWKIVQSFGSFFIIENVGTIWVYSDYMIPRDLFNIIKNNIDKSLPIGVKFIFYVYRPTPTTFKFSNNEFSKHNSFFGFDNSNLSYILYQDEFEETTIFVNESTGTIYNQGTIGDDFNYIISEV